MPSRADDPQTGLPKDDRREPPKDGTWVRYQKVAENLIRGNKLNPIDVTLSFVGTHVEDGQRFRWLELKAVVPDGEGAGTHIFKVLVPEKDLWESDKPFEHARRTWVRKPDGSVAPPPKGFRDDMTYDELLLWTPGLSKGSVAVDDQSKDVDYQAGRLKDCHASTRDLVYKLGKATYTRRCVAWIHPDLPMGFAEAQIIQEQSFNNGIISRYSSTYRIQDAGADAKTELPDHN
jgi:hypothetical protein